MEYKALLAGLNLAKGLVMERIEIYFYSQLAYNQILGIFELKEENLKAYKERSLKKIQEFQELGMILIKREKNSEEIVRLSLEPILKIKLKVEHLSHPSIKGCHDKKTDRNLKIWIIPFLKK